MNEENQMVNTETTNGVDECLDTMVSDFIVIRDIGDDTILVSQRG